MAKAELIYHSKVRLLHNLTEDIAIAELKVWKVIEDENFPEGIKYSLFLVDPNTSKIIMGMDNHKPKGHHIHHGDIESSYKFSNTEKLVEDFWELVKQKDYLL